MGDAVRNYMALYSLTLRLAYEYMALPVSVPDISGNSQTSDYGQYIKKVCGDGLSHAYASPNNGTMKTLEDKSATIQGSLSLALVEIGDNSQNPTSEWGIKQVAKLLNIRNFLGFDIITPPSVYAEIIFSGTTGHGLITSQNGSYASGMLDVGAVSGTDVIGARITNSVTGLMPTVYFEVKLYQLTSNIKIGLRNNSGFSQFIEVNGLYAVAKSSLNTWVTQGNLAVNDTLGISCDSAGTTKFYYNQTVIYMNVYSALTSDGVENIFPFITPTSGTLSNTITFNDIRYIQE